MQLGTPRYFNSFQNIELRNFISFTICGLSFSYSKVNFIFSQVSQASLYSSLVITKCCQNLLISSDIWYQTIFLDPIKALRLFLTFCNSCYSFLLFSSTFCNPYCSFLLLSSSSKIIASFSFNYSLRTLISSFLVTMVLFKSSTWTSTIFKSNKVFANSSYETIDVASWIDQGFNLNNSTFSPSNVSIWCLYESIWWFIWNTYCKI